MSESIGARLRSARERSRLTILQAAEKLHVDPEILEALEADDFEALGAPVYAKGHLRHYAELVGEPAAALFELYSRSTRIAAPDLTRIAKAPPADAGRLIVPVVAAVILLAVAAGIWWGLTLWDRQSGAQPVAIPTRGVPLAQQLPLTPQPGTGTVASPASASGPVPSAAPATAIVPRPSSTAGQVAKPGASARGEIDATLKYSADSWTEVYDGTGRRLLYGMSTGPATRQLAGVPPLSVMLGDADGVTIEVGGHEASIARFVRSDHTARFLIAADGRVLPAPPKKGG
ncbi:MAG: helix-turn-helix domain-containing protein [Proteobacteria bacterium]|nr:helix-turn-helix domain-containing protein [Pseudomonadota bacterium]